MGGKAVRVIAGIIVVLVIVAGVDTEYGQRTLYCQGDYTCRNYGRDWIAYRRKPEE